MIYDPKVSDPAMLRLLAERVEKGVEVRIIGRLGGKKAVLMAEKYPGKRLHVRAIIRDGERAFIGSQSLRKLELEARREIGVLIREPGVVRQLVNLFEEDWSRTETGRKDAKKAGKGEKKESRASARAEAATP